jgi:hypothetical protein
MIRELPLGGALPQRVFAPAETRNHAQISCFHVALSRVVASYVMLDAWLSGGPHSVLTHVPIAKLQQWNGMSCKDMEEVETEEHLVMRTADECLTQPH